MASTPSASALSAVLRCRGNIWSRNPPTKRPASSAYSLGLAGGAMRDSPAERKRPKQATAWEAFLRGQPVIAGRRGLTVAYKSPRMDGKMLTKEDLSEINKLRFPKLSHSRADARSAAPGIRNALVRQLARTLTSNLPGKDTCSKIIRIIQYETHAVRMCKMILVKQVGDFPPGVLKMSITSHGLMENAGQFQSLVLTGWSALKSTCLSLTVLVSDLMFLRMAVLWRSKSSKHDEQDENMIKNCNLQVNGQIHSPTAFTSSKDKPGCGQKITEDRPD